MVRYCFSFLPLTDYYEQVYWLQGPVSNPWLKIAMTSIPVSAIITFDKRVDQNSMYNEEVVKSSQHDQELFAEVCQTKIF